MRANGKEKEYRKMQEKRKNDNFSKFVMP